MLVVLWHRTCVFEDIPDDNDDDDLVSSSKSFKGHVYNSNKYDRKNADGNNGDDGNSSIAMAIPSDDQTPTRSTSSHPGDNAIDPEDNTLGDYTPDYEVLPKDYRDIVLYLASEDWGVNTPMKFQIQAIHPRVSYDDTFILIIVKTGFGKSLIPLTITSICRGVAVIEVPLLGLGSD